MSKERELLKGWLYIAPFWIDPAYMKMYEDTKKLLAEPEQEQEPVAWMYEWVNEIGEHVKSIVYNFYEDSNLIPLYTAPPKREPLSDKEITKNTPKLIHIGERLAFHAGVRFAERYHGIGGGE